VPQLPWPHPPLAPGLGEIPTPIDDAAPSAWRSSRSAWSPLLLWEEALEQSPLRISQICWIVSVGAHGCSSRTLC
jgi:hypothetical protein